jgi:hypothetical protein
VVAARVKVGRGSGGRLSGIFCLLERRLAASDSAVGCGGELELGEETLRLREVPAPAEMFAGAAAGGSTAGTEATELPCPARLAA